MEVITGTALSDKCDYSFGDHLGGRDPETLAGGFSKPANRTNEEFINICKQFEGKVMSLFIDNIRLYPRNMEVKAIDVPYVIDLLLTNDLLGLCASLPKNKFVIFCSHEDTPIDNQIVIPENVLGIHAVNAAHFGAKIHPFPYGLQREINRPDEPKDHRLSILKEEIDTRYQVPTKLLYINCGLGANRNNKERAYLPNFGGLPWVTTRFNEDSMYFPYDRYRDFLIEMRDHKFMICPEGHGMDCHRNWELLYMRRVPVMKKSPYFARLMEGFPVLFVEDWSSITRLLLEENDHLFQEAQTMSLKKLDLGLIFNSIVSSYENNQ